MLLQPSALACRARAASAHQTSYDIRRLRGTRSALCLGTSGRHSAPRLDVRRHRSSRTLLCRASPEADSEPDPLDATNVDLFRSKMQNAWEVEEEEDIKKKLGEAVDGKISLI
eukprot:3796918-Pyramimonas_sp.AAC.1